MTTLRNTILGFVLWLVIMSALILWMGALIVGPAKAKGFEITAYGGVNWNSDFGGSAEQPIFYLDKESLLLGPTTSFAVSSDTGYVIGLALETDLNQIPGLSVGLDASFRSNQLHGSWATVFPDVPPEEGPPLPAIESLDWSPSSTFQGQDQTTALLATARYEYYVVPDKLSVFALGGVGVAHRSLQFGDGAFWSPQFDGDETSFAWKVGAGAGYEIAKGVKLSVAYEYFAGPTISGIVNAGWTEIPFNADGENQSVTMGLTVAFD